LLVSHIRDVLVSASFVFVHLEERVMFDLVGCRRMRCQSAFSLRLRSRSSYAESGHIVLSSVAVLCFSIAGTVYTSFPQY